MKNLHFLGMLRKVVMRLSCAVGFAFLSSVQIASAQMPGNVHENTPKRVIEELASGNSQDIIVVFDDKAAQKSAEEQQSQAGLPSHHSRIIKQKATKYAEMKQKFLSAFAPHESTELKSYSNLPIGFLRIHSKEALDKLLDSSDVAGVYENTVMRKALAESLPLIGQPQAAASGDLGAGTAVAVLDTGVDYTRTAFGSCTAPGTNNCKVVYTNDFTSTNDGMRDDNGHGTNVAGIVLGVAPGTKIVALDVFDGDSAYTSDILAAIDWVIANKATYNIVAMNMSLGSSKYTAPVTNGSYNSAVHQARLAGILTIAAAGNDGYTNALSQPAATTGVVSVGAVYDSTMGSFNWESCPDTDTSFADKVTCFSNSASFLTLLAPGSEILAAGITESGTSQAAPHVAGAVAVLRAAFPGETLDQTVARLTNGVMVTDSRNNITKPRLNLSMALGLTGSCTYSISETSKSYSSISSSGSVAVTTGADCTWSAASNTSSSGWITVTSGSSGSGNGTVNYSISANADTASRTGTITVAGQTYVVTQSGSAGAGAGANILLNPGFEDGPVFWTDSTANGYPVITTYPNPTATNSWYARLCGYNNCVDKLSQDVTIPADAQSAYVQFHYWITTEKTSSVAYDSMRVRIYSPPDATEYTYWTLSNLNATAGWVLSPKYDVSAFKGQAIRLQFSATTDSLFATDFLVDDVTLIMGGFTPDTLAPTVPTGLTAAAVSTSAINLAWNASTDNIGVTAHKLYRDGTLLATLGNVTSYGNTGLAAGTSYTYTVSACDAAGNCSAQSMSASATTNVTRINGACGTSNGGTFAIVPTTNLCDAGDASTVTGAGPWNWSCAGANGGSTASCSAAIKSWTVTPSAGSYGSLSPAAPQIVTSNSTTSFTVSADLKYQPFSITGCGGTLTGSTYTTGPITGDCSVTASFSLLAAMVRNGVVTTAEGRAVPDISDALAVLRYSVKLISLTEAQLAHANVAPLGSNGAPQGDDFINISDALVILRRVVGLTGW